MTDPRRHSKWLALLRMPLGLTAITLLTLVLLTAIFAPIFLSETADAQNLNAIQQGPSAEHLLGTDALGRDLLARTLVATRLSMVLALVAAATGVLGGLILGLLPLFLPGWLGRLLVSAIDIAIAFPALLLALFFAVIFGVGVTGAVLAIGVAIAPGFARLTYTLATSVSGRDFIDAAKVSGAGRGTVVLRHILPNIGDSLVVNGTMIAGDALLSFSALSFLGIGIQPPLFDWGRIFNEGLALLYVNPMAALGPGLAILIAVLAWNLLGEAAAQVIGSRRMVTPGRLPGLPDRQPTNRPDERAALSLENLRVGIPAGKSWLWPVRGVSFTIKPGESVGLVGESGSGKSTTAMAAAKLLQEPIRVTADHVLIAGTDPDTLKGSAQRRHLGTRLAVVFQDPTTSFNPSQRIGEQLAEPAREHAGLSRRAAWERAVERLKSMRISDPASRAKQLPHQFSGGMRQRAMIALGLMGEPALIIADEPTSALDVTVQQKVLQLLDEAKNQHDAALLLISHDIELVAQHCDRVLVMYAGRIVEDLPASELRTKAQHPYTKALLATVPTFATDRSLPLATIPGRPPRLTEIGTGCSFAPRCPNATATCLAQDPDLLPVIAGHRLACWNPATPEESNTAQNTAVEAR